MKPAYDQIGRSYACTRQADPRLAAAVNAALADAASVVNVGAGTGSYEPEDRRVVAVEPSWTMIRQRPAGAAPAVQARAEALPFPDAAFDAALAILTVHHWTDLHRGLAEMRRVASRRVVVLTWDHDVWESFWLIREYLPSIAVVDRRRSVPPQHIVSALGGAEVLPVPIPHDCADGFHGAFWQRPSAYLDPDVRSGISTYALIDPVERDKGLRRLRADLESGKWAARHASLLTLDELDLGYRLIVAELASHRP